MLAHVTIYTDGSCFGNPGPGGWAALFIKKTHSKGNVKKVLYGSEPATTNNRMELLAAIEALEHLKRPCNVSIYSDSQYVEKGITLWIGKWKQNGWRTVGGRQVANKDLWQRLEKAQSRHADVIWNWIPGHGDSEENNIADRYAGKAAYEKKSRALVTLRSGGGRGA